MTVVAKTVIAVALCVAPQIAVAQDVLLRLNPAEGLVTRYHTMTRVWIMSAVMPQGDPDQPIVSQDGYLTRTVAGVSGDVSRITTVVDSARMRLPAAFGPAPPDMTGMRFWTSMDSRGRVLQSGVDEATVPATLRGFEQQIEQMLAAMSFEFPEEPVSPGGSWTNSINETMAGPVGPMATANEGTFTLERVENEGGKRMAVVTLVGTVSQRSVDDPDQPAMMSVDVAGDVEGRFVVDLDTGRIVSMANSTSLEGEVRIGNSASGIPMLITSETTVALVPGRR